MNSFVHGTWVRFPPGAFRPSDSNNPISVVESGRTWSNRKVGLDLFHESRRGARLVEEVLTQSTRPKCRKRRVL